ncbi:hypothetical protein RRG08_040907 [Elysia crispata]|uniref:Uncharacterized protein n=1 Tax=Elysia crispata TaxID=231223 RepID=A0AAE0ZRN7_9GAST|nr:hypothetical protein RRG08_040907 [Elysia crispata]
MVRGWSSTSSVTEYGEGLELYTVSDRVCLHLEASSMNSEFSVVSASRPCYVWVLRDGFNGQDLSPVIRTFHDPPQTFLGTGTSMYDVIRHSENRGKIMCDAIHSVFGWMTASVTSADRRKTYVWATSIYFFTRKRLMRLTKVKQHMTS